VLLLLSVVALLAAEAARRGKGHGPIMDRTSLMKRLNATWAGTTRCGSITPVPKKF